MKTHSNSRLSTSKRISEQRGLVGASVLAVGTAFGLLWLRRADAAEDKSEEWKYIVVGGGAAAHYAVTSLRERDSSARVHHPLFVSYCADFSGECRYYTTISAATAV